LDYDAARDQPGQEVAGVVTAIVYGAIRRLARIVLVHHHAGYPVINSDEHTGCRLHVCTQLEMPPHVPPNGTLGPFRSYGTDQCAWKSAWTVAMPERDDPKIAAMATTPRGKSKFAIAARNIAANGRAITK
jgi:hypothetical protein